MKRMIALVSALVLSVSALGAQWSTPALVPGVNTASSEFDPSPSRDALTLYFSSDRTVNYEIFRATRTSPYGTFGPAVQIVELGTTRTEAGPCVSGDELEIIFYSNRAGGAGSLDLWRATRPSIASSFSPPVPIAELNTPGVDAGPSLTADGLVLVFQSGRAGGIGGDDLWLAMRSTPASRFGPPINLRELNTTGYERDPVISGDGLAIFFTVGTSSAVNNWMATRLSTAMPFGPPVNLTTINSTSNDIAPGIARFRDEIFFCSSRVAGRGIYDIFSARFTGVTSDGRASPGGVMRLSFSDPSSPSAAYVCAASFGDTPGFPIDTRRIPLNPDALFGLTLGGLPSILTGYTGRLDADGVAKGAIAIPPSLAFVGARFFNAFVVLGPSAPSGVKTISNAHEVLVVR